MARNNGAFTPLSGCPHPHRHSGGHLDFEVADDGAGFDLARHADGEGLLHMRDRIGAVGATLEVESSSGDGTTVSGRVPVAD
jgi:signal transduction histidine kinase